MRMLTNHFPPAFAVGALLAMSFLPALPYGTAVARPVEPALSVAAMRAGEMTPAPIDNAGFAPGPNAQPAPAFAGTLRIVSTAMSTQPARSDFSAAMVDSGVVALESSMNRRCAA